MLILLAVPVIAAVAAMHRHIQVYAPSNILMRRVRAREPRWSVAAALGLLVGVLLVAMHLLGAAVAAGAPGWLNLGVLVLAWDAIKLGVLSTLTAGRCVLSGCANGWRVVSRRPSVTQDSTPTVSA